MTGLIPFWYQITSASNQQLASLELFRIYGSLTLENSKLTNLL